MCSISHDSDIEFELHFLDCHPDAIDRSLNEPSVFDHLYRAATQKILQLENSDERNQSHRVTDIDQLALLLDQVTFTPKSMTRHVAIEVTQHEDHHVDIPIIRSETKLALLPPQPLAEVPVATEGVIPPAPPLPPSLDLALKLQSEARKAEALLPDQESLWMQVGTQNVADYFTQLAPSTNPQYASGTNESKQQTVLDKRKSYNLGRDILPLM